MARVGRPPAKDPKISKTVTLKSSEWYLIEQSKSSRAAFMAQMLKDYREYDGKVQELQAEYKDFDIRQMSVKRLYVATMNAMAQIDGKMYADMMIYYQDTLKEMDV